MYRSEYLTRNYWKVEYRSQAEYYDISECLYSPMQCKVDTYTGQCAVGSLDHRNETYELTLSKLERRADIELDGRTGYHCARSSFDQYQRRKLYSVALDKPNILFDNEGMTYNELFLQTSRTAAYQPLNGNLKKHM